MDYPALECISNNPLHVRAIQENITWYPVEMQTWQDYVLLPDAQDRCLFYSWPRGTPTYKDLKDWKGDFIVTVAEVDGCTGDFYTYVHEHLDGDTEEDKWCQQWHVLASSPTIYNWSGIRDFVHIFSRRS